MGVTPRKKKTFNGKPLSHWQKMADELFIDSLLRAYHRLDYRSLPGKMARKKILSIALTENPKLWKRMQNRRARFLVNVSKITAGL